MIFIQSLFCSFHVNREGELSRKGKKKRKTAGEMKYADFFDPPDGEPIEKKGSENESEDENEDDEQMEAKDDDEEEIEDDEASVSSDIEMDSDEENTKGISSFEKKQQKVNLQQINLNILTLSF